MFPAIKRTGRKPPSIKNLSLLVALSLTHASFAQTTSAISAPAAAPLTFEVSTVKLNTSGSGSSHSGLDSDRFSATNVALKNLMQHAAYGIPQSRILGGPKWLDTQRFDIEAKMSPTVADQIHKLPPDQRRLQQQAMFQQLLANRFHLKVHWETRQLPIYALIIAKGGPKLKPSATSSGTNTSSGNNSGGSYLSASDISLSALADTLTQELASELGRVIIDKTALPGQYDVSLKWTTESTTPQDHPTDSGPSIFTAIQEQLGLKLSPSKGPVQVLVIDSLEMPTEN